MSRLKHFLKQIYLGWRWICSMCNFIAGIHFFWLLYETNKKAQALSGIIGQQQLTKCNQIVCYIPNCLIQFNQILIYRFWTIFKTTKLFSGQLWVSFCLDLFPTFSRSFGSRWFSIFVFSECMRKMIVSISRIALKIRILCTFIFPCGGPTL